MATRNSDKNDSEAIQIVLSSLDLVRKQMTALWKCSTFRLSTLGRRNNLVVAFVLRIEKPVRCCIPSSTTFHFMVSLKKKGHANIESSMSLAAFYDCWRDFSHECLHFVVDVASQKPIKSTRSYHIAVRCCCCCEL